MQRTISEKEFDRLSAIVRIHHTIGAVLDLSEIARILVRELADMLECDACAILFIEDNEVKILAEKGFVKAFGAMKFTPEVPAIKYVLDTRQSLLTGDVLNSPAAGCIPYGCFMSSLICVPVEIAGLVRSIIHIDSTTRDAFNQADLEFIEMLAREAALAMERSLLYSKVVDVSIKDSLTGCYNRRKLDIDIAAETSSARQCKKPLSLLMIDIDLFKSYNDFHGHPKGDELLKKLVDLLAKHVRASDHIYRYGGEEFVLLLPGAGKVQAAYIGTRLREIVESELFEGEADSQPDKKITISIGAATFPVDVKDWSGLIKAADSALYRAKQTGRNKVCSYVNGENS
jgi:diguanylate cyclase (GGDEF)-like protein